MRPRFLFVVSLSLLLLVGSTYAKVKGSPAKRPVKKEQAAEPAPPPPPQTLAEMPPSSPEVSFQSGQLTISAKNSTLGDILNAVKTQTRATIEVPGNASERVVGHFGPGPARDVLTSLLNGSHFNYLLLGSPSDPNALDRVILMAKSAGSASTPPSSEQATAYNPAPYGRPMAPMAAPGANTTVVEGESADDSADDSADTTDDDTTADDQSDQTDQTDDQTTGEEEQQQAPEGQANVKSPEQLLQELQQRQQQLLQQQQQGIQPGAAGFPTPGASGVPPGPGMPPGAPHN